MKEEEPRREGLASAAGRATGAAIVKIGRNLINTKGRRPRIVAHTSGIPPISRMHYNSGLEGLKPRFLRGTDITGRKTR